MLHHIHGYIRNVRPWLKDMPMSFMSAENCFLTSDEFGSCAHKVGLLSSYHCRFHMPAAHQLIFTVVLSVHSF